MADAEWSQAAIALAFEQAGLENAANEARWLLQHIRAKGLDGDEAGKLVRRRCTGEPFQYVLGETDFYGYILKVGPGVLIPRPETEELVEHAADFLRKNAPAGAILDVCTGSGAIAIVLAKLFPERPVVASDISDGALAWAKENCQMQGVSNLKLLKSDLFENIPPTPAFALFTANPPYVTEEEYSTLDGVVRNYEPRLALVAEEHGLKFYGKIAADVRSRLLPGAAVFMEIGCEQGIAVRELLSKEGFSDCDIIKDLSGRDRIATARWMPSPSL